MMLQGRIKERYNARPTERERNFHLWLMAEFECGCGCGGAPTVVHHPLTRHPEQRWRRDHEFVVPMTDGCHREVHRRGHERDAPFNGLADRAAWLREQAIEAGKL